jgi:uncharacterized membrane protein
MKHLMETVVLIAIIAAVTVICTVGPAAEFAGWFR